MSRLRIAGALVAVAIGIVVWVVSTHVSGAKITGCGFDSNGPWAKVNVTSLVGGFGSTEKEGVLVTFSNEGQGYTYAYGRVKVPMFGTTTTIVRPFYKEESAENFAAPKDPSQMHCALHPPANGWQ